MSDTRDVSVRRLPIRHNIKYCREATKFYETRIVVLRAWNKLYHWHETIFHVHQTFLLIITDFEQILDLIAAFNVLDDSNRPSCSASKGRVELIQLLFCRIVDLRYVLNQPINKPTGISINHGNESANQSDGCSLLVKTIIQNGSRSRAILLYARTYRPKWGFRPALVWHWQQICSRPASYPSHVVAQPTALSFFNIVIRLVLYTANYNSNQPVTFLVTDFDALRNEQIFHYS